MRKKPDFTRIFRILQDVEVPLFPPHYILFLCVKKIFSTLSKFRYSRVPGAFREGRRGVGRLYPLGGQHISPAAVAPDQVAVLPAAVAADQLDNSA